MAKEKIQAQIDQIEKIYQVYLQKLAKLQQQQNKEIKNFSQNLKEKEINQLRRNIKSL